MNMPRLFIFLAGLGLLGWAAPGLALTEYCVAGNQLQAALNQAAIDGDDSLIKIKSGTATITSDITYDTSATETLIVSGRLTLRGGYNADCSSYSLVPGSTTLASTNASDLRISNRTNDISVAGIGMQGVGMRFDSGQGECPAQVKTIDVRRVRIDQAYLAVYATCHDATVQNVLITNGDSSASRGDVLGLAVRAKMDQVDESEGREAHVTIVNTTVMNARTDLWGGVLGEDGGTVYLINSIFDSSGGSDIFATKKVKVLSMFNRHEPITFSEGAMLVPGSGNNLSVAPNLDANFVPLPTSAMRNSGTSNVPGGLPAVDLAGNARVVGTAVDRGALEYQSANGITLTVTHANASGSGSLAWAIAQANADPDFNLITFNIPGGCPQRITPGAQLTLNSSMSILGNSQPGSRANTSEYGFDGIPCIVLNGGATRGIGIATGAGLGNGFVTLRGLALENYDTAIQLTHGVGSSILGNQFGGFIPGSGGASGITLAGNGGAIHLGGVSNTHIGGVDVGQRNLIGQSSGAGIVVSSLLGAGDGSGNLIANNLIGLNKYGISALPNGNGVSVLTADNELLNNHISRNLGSGVSLLGEAAHGNQITGNTVGALLAGFLGDGNGGAGISLGNGAYGNRIQNNKIAGNTAEGVRMAANAGGKNHITGNGVYLNGRDSGALGIDLGAAGVSPNDIDPSVCAPQGCAANGGQNFPRLTQARRGLSGELHPPGRPLRIAGLLRSTVGTHRVELFSSDACHASGHGEGQRVLAAFDVTIPNATWCPPTPGACEPCQSGNCTMDFSRWVEEAEALDGDAITATATNSLGNTSEFSQCITLDAPEPAGNAIFADGFED
mgnify:CR=1 FL=1